MKPKILQDIDTLGINLAERAKQVELEVEITNRNIAVSAEQIARQTEVAVERARIDLLKTSAGDYYIKCLSTDTGALLVVASGATTGQINLASVTPRLNTYTPIAGDYARLVSNGLTAETVDIRIDINGKIHPSAGVALREQINEVYDNIDGLNVATNNFFDTTKVVVDKAIGNWVGATKDYTTPSTGKISSQPIDLSLYGITQFCFITNKTYWNTRPNLTCFFGNDGLFLSAITATQNVYDVPVGAKYVRFTLLSGYPADLQFKKYDVSMSFEYEPYLRLKNWYSKPEIDLNITSIKKDLENLLSNTNLVESVGEVIPIFNTDITKYTNLNSKTRVVIENSMVVAKMIETGTGDSVNFSQAINYDLTGDFTLLFGFYLTREMLEMANLVKIYFAKDIGTYSTDNYNVVEYYYKFVEGWNFFKYKLSDFTKVGTIDASLIKIMKVEVVKKSAYAGTSYNLNVIFSQTIKNHRMKPTVIVNFDDSSITVLDRAFPYMEKRGIKGTVFLSNRSVSTNYLGVTNLYFMTPEQHLFLENHGWEIGMHSKSHNDLVDLETSMVYADQYEEMIYNWNYIIDNGLKLPTTFSAPNGKLNNITIDILKALGVRVIRAKDGPISFYDKTTLRVPSLTLFLDTTDAMVEAYINRAIDYGDIISVYTHSILTEGTADAYSCTIPQFYHFIDIVYSNLIDGKLRDLTFREVRELAIK